MCVDQCICAIRAVEMPELACLSSSYSEVTEVGGMKFFEDISDGVDAKLWRICGCVQLNLAVEC